MTTRNFMIVLSLLIDASYAFNKCCSPGEVFTGTSKVNCAPTPLNCSIELFLANGSNSGFPICEKPEYIATTPLDQLNSMSFVQNTSCIEILHEPSTSQNVPILVHCNSNEKEQLFSSQSLSKLRFLNVRRCCSSNEVFNVMPGNCESSKNVEDDLLTFFNVTAKDEFQNIKIISINKELLECPKSNAMFTYEIDAEDVTILDESLKVKVYSWENQTVESFTITEKNSCLAVTPDFRSKRRIVVRVCRDEELCRDGNCVNKCFKKTKSMCQEILISNLTFYDKISNITGTPRNVTEYGVIRFELNCSNGMYMERIEDTFGISSNGSLKLLSDREWLTQDSYCVDMLFNNKQDNYCKEDLYALICFPERTENIRKILKTILEGISFIFLLLTLIVYICLPVLQNLHGKTLMSHVASLMIGYLCISLLPWLRDIKQNNIIFCCASGFLLLFSFLSAFSWLNIMCFDIWRTFGRLQGNFTRDQNHGKTFLLYCLYAWGLPMFITVFGILDDQILILPNNFRPHFNEYCWFKGHGQIIYFRGVVAIQLLTNMVFFFLTTKQCNKVKAELKKVTIDPSDPRNKQFLANKSKFIINMKLFIVMGISWIGEIVSALIENYAPFKYQNQLFYLTDTFNCLQGLWIFILFVVKRRVHQALKKRLGFDEKKKFSRVTASLQDPFKMRKSVSNSTLTSTFAVSSIP